MQGEGSGAMKEYEMNVANQADNTEGMQMAI